MTNGRKNVEGAGVRAVCEVLLPSNGEHSINGEHSVKNTRMKRNQTQESTRLAKLQMVRCVDNSILMPNDRGAALLDAAIWLAQNNRCRANPRENCPKLIDPNP